VTFAAVPSSWLTALSSATEKAGELLWSAFSGLIMYTPKTSTGIMIKAITDFFMHFTPFAV
jgi:hypothetical protein